MATEFRVPDLGEGITEAEVLRVLVSEGDTIEQEQPIIEAETDKAIFEVPCDVAGRVTRVHVNEGDTITAGQVILNIEEVSVQAVPAAAPPPEAAPAAPPQAAAEPAAPAADREGEPAPAPAEIAASSAEPARPAAAPATQTPASAARPVDGERAPAFASPAVRGFAREIGINIYSVAGTGPGGRISTEDVKEHARTSSSDGGGAQAAAGPLAAPPLPDFSPFGATERERMGGVRRATARGMSESWSTIPHVTLFAKADVTALQEFRQRHRARAEAAGGNLTLLAIMLKIVAAGLKAFPKLNASADMEAMETVYKRYYHVGVAVDTDRGLLVPVIREVDRKSIVELSVELAELAEKARAGTAEPGGNARRQLHGQQPGGLRHRLLQSHHQLPGGRRSRPRPGGDGAGLHRWRAPAPAADAALALARPPAGGRRRGRALPTVDRPGGGGAAADGAGGIGERYDELCGGLRGGALRG